jgi:hypothetical protein
MSGAVSGRRIEKASRAKMRVPSRDSLLINRTEKTYVFSRK